MRVILDSNVLLSAFFKFDSPPYKLVHAWMDGRFELVSCAEQIEEIMRVTRYPQIRRLIEPTEAGWLINRLRDRAALVSKLLPVDISADPADNFLFSLAQASEANYLVTGDRSDVLSHRKYASTQIVTAREMASVLKI